MLLENAGTVDLRVAQLTDIEVLSFSSGTSAALLRDDQIGGSGIGLVGGNAAVRDRLLVNGAGIDLSSVQFSGWSTDDIILLNGTAGADTIIGSTQNDTITGGLGADLLDGGDGNDLVNYTASTQAVDVDLANGIGVGGEADGDTLTGIEQVLGSAFDDTLRGGTPAELLAGRAGNDSLFGGAGTDSLFGAADSDSLNGGTGADLLFGGSESDSLLGGGDNDTLFGGTGDDTLRGGGNNDAHQYAIGDGIDRVIDAGGAADLLAVGSFDDIVSAVQSGNNLVIEFVDGGRVTVVGHFTTAGRVENIVDSNGNVVVLAAGPIGGAASGLIAGTEENDSLDGRGGDDILFGNDGDDLLLGGLGDDKLSGGRGLDSMSGGGGSDTLGGGFGDDLLVGKGGADKLFGAPGDDRLNGGTGNDTLIGGRGTDTLNGGADFVEDVFRFNEAAHIGLGPSGDVLHNFGAGTDKIDVSGIDAQKGAAGDQAFTFIGTGEFTAAGQIRAVQVGFHTVLQFNIESGGGAEAELVLIEVIAASLAQDDFFL